SKTVATAGTDKTIRIWQLEDDKELRTFDGHEGDVVAVHFLPDGKRLVSGSADKTVRLWDVETGKQVRAWEKLAGAVKGLAVSADGKLVAAGLEIDGEMDAKAEPAKSIFEWEIESGREASAFAAPHFAVSGVAFAPDGKTLAATGNGLRIWDVTSNKARFRFEQASIYFTSVAYSPDGKTLALGSAGHTVWLVDPKAADLAPLDAHQGTVVAVAFSADGQSLTSVSDAREVRTWNVATSKVVRRAWRCVEPAKGKRNADVLFALSPDGQTLAAHKGDSVLAWNQAKGEEIVDWKRDDKSRAAAHAAQVAFAHDSPRLAFSGSDTVVEIVDLAKKAPPQAFVPKEGSVAAIALSPDGKTLAVVTGKSAQPESRIEGATAHVTLCDVDDKGKSRSLPGEVSLVALEGRGDASSRVLLAFAPNGRWLAAVGADGTAHIWDL